MATPNALLSSENSEWLTPEVYIEAARQVLGAIGLDPASSAWINKNRIGASVFYDIKANGLLLPWAGSHEGTVWLNPPYGFLNENLEPFKKGDQGKQSSVSVWMDKMLDEFYHGNFRAGIVLVNNTAEAAWFQNLWRFPICFTDHRIQFELLLEDGTIGTPKQPTRGNAFVMMTADQEWAGYFASVFDQFGHIAFPDDMRGGYGIEDC